MARLMKLAGASPATGSKPMSSAPPPAGEQKVNVLLVDDQPVNLMVLEKTLSDLGQNVVKAQSGEEAFRHLQENDFAVVLLDVQMPGLDGFETAKLIRSQERSRHTPIIFITAHRSPDFPVVQAYVLGAVDYLEKPIVPVILRAKVMGFVELFRKTEQIKRQAGQLAQRTAELEAANWELKKEIAERKRMEKALRRAATDLTRSNRELQQFAYVASHDLKEPLRKVKIYLQMLEQRYRGRLDGKADQYIGYAVDGAERMQALVNDLLAFARVGSQGQPFEPTDCGAAFDQAVNNLEVAVRESGAVIARGDFPMLRADASQLVQMFQNLLANALKFRGDHVPSVRAEARRAGGEWVFSVRDNGIGLDPQFAERIFLIFERLHGKERYPGTGIGLAICKKIVERHGGRIWVESAPGAGATFFFSIAVIGDSHE
jgi:signal transduction histidine kinase